MANIEDIKYLLEMATVSGGVDERSIQEAEERLGVRFPPTYRAFLSQFGAALCDGFRIEGLFVAENDDEPPLWANAVESTLQLRQASRGTIPREYVVISDDGGDYTYYLDTSRPDAQGECPVVVLGPGADSVIVAHDFVEFISRSFEGSLSF